MTQTVSIAGVPILAGTLGAAVDHLSQLAVASRTERVGTHVHFANTYTIALADSSPELFAILRAPEALVYPDGKPVAWTGRVVSRGRHLHQVRGPSAFEELLRLSDQSGPTHFFLGGTPQTLSTLVEQVRRLNPLCQVVGAESPPFRELDQHELSAQWERIRVLDPDIVWYGLGTPKQDFLASAGAAHARGVHVAIGAAFDFLAGTKPSAPSWIQSMALEWLFRFATEPARLWRRYTIGIGLYLRAVWRHRA